MSLGGEKNDLQRGSVDTVRSRSIKIIFSGDRMFAKKLCHIPMCSSGLISHIAISFMNGQCDMSMPPSVAMPKCERLRKLTQRKAKIPKESAT